MNKRSIEFKWSLIFVAMMLAWMWLEKISGLHDVHIDKHATYTNLMAFPAIAIYVFALLEKRKKDLGGSMTYMQGFTTGLIITLIITIISPFSQLVTSYYITPDFFTNAKNYAISTGNMDQAAAEQYFSIRNYLLMGLIGGTVMGIITSAVVAIFTRKSKEKRASELRQGQVREIKEEPVGWS